MSILDYFPPGLTPRPEQRKLLLEIEAAWSVGRVFVINAPTGFGKTEIEYTLAHWSAAQGDNAAMLYPDNVLTNQTLDRYDLPALHRQSYYKCVQTSKRCDSKSRCKGCPYQAAKKEAKNAPVRVMNTYVYWSHKMYAKTLLVDEGDKLVEMLHDKRDLKIPHGHYRYPKNIREVGDVIDWIQRRLAKDGDDYKLRICLQEILRIKHEAGVEYRQGSLVVYPTTPRNAPPWLWPPSKVKRILLLSATISRYEVEDLGLHIGRKVVYLQGESPIPADRRQVIFDPQYNMSRKYQQYAMPEFVRYLKEKLALHPDKGLVHLPYELAEQLREQIQDPRLMFHDKDDKRNILKKFKDSPTEQGKVLIASGLYSGVDLAMDAARWQIIGKCPWASLGDLRVKTKAEQDNNWYDWQAIAKIIQAAGRITRSADDYGITYIPDITFKRLLDADDDRKEPLIPRYFREAIVTNNQHK